ncbi:ABC transporter substrate-binding protein [Isoptericola sp. NPDC019571]|uniref:ABC transporter substrate-binding protein n=1 Tax=Isoptericola sp. NPDC019571 TaxID=3364008 RepID=UPI00378E6FF1
MNTATQRRTTAVAASVAALALTLSACSSGNGTGDEGSGATGSFEYLSLAENTAVKDTLTALSTDLCSQQESDSPLKVTTQPQASFDQQLQLLAGQGALPSVFATGNSPEVIKDIHESGQLVDIDAELETLGKSDAIIPAARSTIEALYDGEVYVLPSEFNVEGIWYNKTLFQDNGIEIPETWDDLVAASATLEKAGVTPMAAAGKDGWPLTRLVGNYIYRALGPDALKKVADGEAKLTDPQYVDAAAQVAALGEAGAFGKSVGSIDYTTAMNQFLTGKAGMYYMGSWALANFNDESQNTVGAENIGFVPFPNVEGGAGDSTQLAANIGVPLAMSKDRFDEGAKNWLSCIADGFGPQSLTGQGVVTGFKAETDADVPPLTTTVLGEIDKADTTVLWFEALFNPKATTTATSNAQLLVTGQMSPEDYMAAVQADLG